MHRLVQLNKWKDLRISGVYSKTSIGTSNNNPSNRQKCYLYMRYTVLTFTTYLQRFIISFVSLLFLSYFCQLGSNSRSTSITIIQTAAKEKERRTKKKKNDLFMNWEFNSDINSTTETDLVDLMCYGAPCRWCILEPYNESNR